MSHRPVPPENPPQTGRSHLCWAFTEPAEFFARARAFLVEGLAAGKRVCLTAPGTERALLDQVATIPGIGDLLERGAVLVRSLDGVYAGGGVVDPEEQVRVYAGETDQAVADGFTGFRVAAEATHLVRTPAHLDAFASYEHVVDRYMAASTFDAMCAYNVPELGADTVDKLATMHPGGNVDTVPFHLHGWGRGGAVALDGELDLRSRELFPWALEHAAPGWGGGEVVVDARGLTFIDHHALLRLADQAERRGFTAVLRTRAMNPARLVEILGISGVRVEQVA
ncbi:anti-anti-sigma regulatory factor [Actinokineospora baliensis]|uniref:MEDS domain-containing protein n=1 Tax=Actinokineospora baliensis TaxID=547056 RepID=UPI00195D560E|nr:MEDS domain-containing protein [Actinokineospora baliensis]MBM7774301.1 anti-anti-sigma regulatory factor [Actinokineospora baliensis]